MLKKPLFTRKNQDCTAKNQIGNIVFNYRFTGNSRIKINQRNNKTYNLSDHRCECSTENFEMQPTDKQNIKNSVQYCSNCNEIKWPF